MATTTLPAHIRQLVDKKNYVIAIKTHAQEQNISLDDAKAQIDAYEQSQLPSATTPVPTMTNSVKGLDGLKQGLDTRLQDENIKIPLIPRWVWRVGVIVLVMLLIAFVIYRLFR